MHLDTAVKLPMYLRYRINNQGGRGEKFNGTHEIYPVPDPNQEDPGPDSGNY